MAIGAHEFAFLELLDDHLSCAARDHAADLVDFVEARQMIPVHHIDRKHSATIYTGQPLLKAGHPPARLVDGGTLARQSGGSTSIGVIPPVVCTSAVAAVRKLPGSGVMEVARGSPAPAYRAQTERHLVDRPRR